MGVPTYETLHILHNEIKSNAMAVRSNPGGEKYGYLVLVVSPTDYALITNNPFVFQVHLGDLATPIAATHHPQEELKHQYEKNLQVLYEIRGVEWALIKKLVLAVEARCITPMRNRTTVQFIGYLFMLTQYLIVTYGKIPPSQLIDLKQNTKSMQYNPQTPINTVLNQVKDLL